MTTLTGTSATDDGEVLDPGAEALWLLQRFAPDKGVSNVAMGVEFDAPVQWWPMQEALNWLVRRHRALRGYFPFAAGRPVRRDREPADVDLTLQVLATGPETVDEELRVFAAAPFDVERPPLMRAGLFRVGPARTVMCLVAHHLVIDAASLRIVVTELGAAYRSYADGGDEPPSAPPVVATTAAISAEALDYWRKETADHDASGMLLDGAVGPPVPPTFAAHLAERPLAREAVRAIHTLRRECRTTDAMVVLGAYQTVLYRHGAGGDSLVGVMLDTRAADERQVVGHHVVTMPIRVPLHDRRTFADVVRDVTAATVRGMEHGPLPFELLVRESTVTADDPAWWRGPLVRCLFNYRPEVGATEPVGSGSRVLNLSTGLTRFDLELTVVQAGADTVAGLLISTEVYPTELADQLIDRIEAVLVQAAADPARPVGALDLLSATDHAVVCRANDTDVAWPRPDTVLELIEVAAHHRPAAAAVVDQGVTTSYAQLLQAAAGVRDELRRYGAGPGTVVGVGVPRGASVAAITCGIWATGAAYLPLDPQHPVDRLRDQLDDAGCTLVYGDDLAGVCTTGRTCLSPPVFGSVTDPDRLPHLDAPPSGHPAYLIYTSGSTGRSKGVVLTHANLANLIRDFGDRLGVDHTDATLWLTTFAFDISALELFLPLALGGRVVVASDETRTRPDDLVALVERENVTVIQATPTTWRLTATAARGRLAGRTVLCGGEPLPETLAARLHETGARVLNVYGPTETTIWSTAAELVPGEPVTVGTPIANTRVHILDEHGREQPVGRTGELCIAGAGVALGYHGRPDLTRERFPEHEKRGRVYRTGDVARWRFDGALELLGRADRQVKLRAHRIELGEVEAVLESHPDVRSAAVHLRGDPSSADGRLVAFVACAQRTGRAAELWAHAARRLPAYSLPAQIIVLEALPSTPNGKIDHVRMAGWDLPEQDRTPSPATAADDDLELSLVGLWRAVLGRAAVRADTNFFLNGGTSLSAVRLAQEATEQSGTAVTMAMVFQAPTPAQLAATIRGTAARVVAQ